jgi:hypothetical protein
MDAYDFSEGGELAFEDEVNGVTFRVEGVAWPPDCGYGRVYIYLTHGRGAAQKLWLDYGTWSQGTDAFDRLRRALASAAPGAGVEAARAWYAAQ